MKHEAFGQGSVEFGKEPIALGKGSGREPGKPAKQTNIHGVDLEGRDVVKSSKRQPRGRTPADLVSESRIDQPLQGLLVFARPCSLLDQAIEKLLVFLCELRRNRVPNFRALGGFANGSIKIPKAKRLSPGFS